MKLKILLCLILLLGVIAVPCFGSDDITLMGEVRPIYRLDRSFSEQIIDSEANELTITVSDVIAESDRVLIRFFIPDIPSSLKGKITDENRLYGSYLPIAEITDAMGGFWTPSSASKYSFLEYNSRLIVGGLLIFENTGVLQTFYLNFNQIPFDTKLLSEGFSHAVILSAASSENGNHSTGTGQNLTARNSDLEFTLTAAAQTNDLTMLQPAVKMLREDEELTKFGWISVADPVSGKRYAVTRESIYGFNLSDDDTYSPAHAYIFQAVQSEAPLEIGMDHACVIRTFPNPPEAKIDLSEEFSGLSLTADDDFFINLSEISIISEEEKMRLYLDTGELQAVDVSFDFNESDFMVEPNIYCGIDPTDDRFACDFYFDQSTFPQGLLDFRITAIEYQKKGPWTIHWNPVPMDIASQIVQNRASVSPFLQREEVYTPSPNAPEEIRSALEQIRLLSYDLTKDPGWIRESILWDYSISGMQDLIQADQYDQFYQRYIMETWSNVGENGLIHEILTIVRDPDTHLIRSANLTKDGLSIDLIHALKVNTSGTISSSFTCFSDFADICSSSAVFVSAEDCSDETGDAKCLQFYHSLSGSPSGTAYQSINFRMDPSTGFVYSSEIDYNHGALQLRKTTLALEKSVLPDDVSGLLDSIYE